MKAFVVDRYAKNADLRAAEVPVPVLGDHDVLVAVHAAGVNLLDAKIRDGEFKLVLKYGFPLILGNDLAGVVAQVGPRVSQFKAGDRVYARPDKDRIGTFAEFIAVDEKDLAHKPASLSMAEAAAVPLVALTAWQALVDIADVKPGQRVFIQAGTGGVGTIAIQLAKHLGATVATTCSARSFELVKSLGADVVIDYKTQDFAEILHDYDVVVHSQDSAELAKSLRVLKRGGHVISISGPPDHHFAREVGAPWPVAALLRMMSAGVRRKARKLGVEYSFLFMKADGAELQAIADLIDRGVIRPVIDSVLPFSGTNEAIARVAAGHAKGKVVITVAGAAS
ncbi:NADP-dependent oxidoreductase [Mycobacterium sp. M26]|uniref:NADP-dependent oxidoreductase n=1 Tax=Mycobacterium sp. M26 TaxID=1762962 RepID=UPI00073ED714|nr:NADP-dependent oxidoreductase [Mycobacterium sp. M26]